MWQRLQQIRREPAGTRASVENKFVAPQLQTGKDLLSPADLRLREAVIFGGVPFAVGV